MVCKICNGETDKIFKKEILGKYPVSYFQCSNCLFIQTEKPFWLNEAYENSITSLDIGLVNRNLYLATIAKSIICTFFEAKSKFLDYGGGYGLFVRIMRDSGFAFYRQDKFCENLFSKHFDITDMPDQDSFELVTAFELFEHFENPLEEIDNIYKRGNNILFSTVLQPNNSSIQEWDYLLPEIGQHISFYNYRTLLEISKKYKMHLYSNKKNIHLLSKRKVNGFLFKSLTRRKIATLYNLMLPQLKSLLDDDYRMIKGKFKSE